MGGNDDDHRRHHEDFFVIIFFACFLYSNLQRNPNKFVEILLSTFRIIERLLGYHLLPFLQQSFRCRSQENLRR
ncbi:hypothetical protein, partial [Enterococcus faecalis]|uniref:hypothetical protein n=1 Tax=Enterococcus faecalis TaxID=1351 RepID=UPI0022F105CB